mmetsp:Transcript_15471/g.50496  ORF Transcript_15471/g.50496 Transcript_15471/m.50496 type:complete len:279 (+) Transcript_15471:344-1180(+)
MTRTVQTRWPSTAACALLPGTLLRKSSMSSGSDGMSSGMSGAAKLPKKTRSRGALPKTEPQARTGGPVLTTRVYSPSISLVIDLTFSTTRMKLSLPWRRSSSATILMNVYTRLDVGVSMSFLSARFGFDPDRSWQGGPPTTKSTGRPPRAATTSPVLPTSLTLLISQYLPCCPAVVVKASSSSSTATYSSTLIWSSLSTCSSVPMPSKQERTTMPSRLRASSEIRTSLSLSSFALSFCFRSEAAMLRLTAAKPSPSSPASASSPSSLLSLSSSEYGVS